MRDRLGLGHLVLREMQYAKLNTALGLITVAVATGVLVAMLSITRSTVDETRRMMKDMGFNLLITPPGIDPARYQALDFGGGEMPEACVTTLAGSTALAQHFVGKYQQTIELNGAVAVLTGVLPELTKHGTVKKPMPTAYEVPQGKVKAGSAIARALGLEAGQSIEIRGTAFTVDALVEEKGSSPDDIRIYAHLHDVQRLLDKPGLINAIDALACFCPVDTDDILAALERTVRSALPDVNVAAYKSILLARQRQRNMMYRLELAALGIVMAAAAAAIWNLTYQNVNQRRHEIGVLRALGVAGWRIGALFTIKILAYGVSGAALGCLAGYWAGPALQVTTKAYALPMFHYGALIVAAPLVAVLFGLPPIVSGLLQEPIGVLEEGGT